MRTQVAPGGAEGGSGVPLASRGAAGVRESVGAWEGGRSARIVRARRAERTRWGVGGSLPDFCSGYEIKVCRAACVVSHHKRTRQRPQKKEKPNEAKDNIWLVPFEKKGAANYKKNRIGQSHPERAHTHSVSITRRTDPNPAVCSTFLVQKTALGTPL